MLAWLQGIGPWSVFVQNRVEEILKLSDRDVSVYVPGDQNPADILSRGCTAKKLVKSKWWKGLIWLRHSLNEQLGLISIYNEQEILEEKRKIVVSCISISMTFILVISPVI